MTHQKSEDGVVPEGQRKLSPTHGVSDGGGKAVPIEEVSLEQLLLFATAESPRAARGAESVPNVDLSTGGPTKAPKAKSKTMHPVTATLNEVAGRLDESFDKVEANKGAPGPDRQRVEAVRKHWPDLRRMLAEALLDGTYRPGDIRRVWIPKSGGGERGLGIPNVLDRVVQEAVRGVLEPLYEPTFHTSSHGFRPGRSCHTALAEAASYVEAGHTWVVDIDLEKFFDRVHHQRLMARLAQRVEDRQLLTLINHMLKAKVVMPDGVRVATEEGVPQGGPLSPLLSNVVLSELDTELARRGLRFVRYADDCNIYVRSERAGKRVMESVTRFINRRLRLSVNAAKSAVARPETRHFLGFRLRPQANSPPEILLSERSEKRLKERVRELTPRNNGQSLQATIRRVNQYLSGWDGFFRICTEGVERVLGNTDAHIRRRLRARLLHHWRQKRTIARRLIGLGVSRRTAWRRVYFANRGLVSLLARARARWTVSDARGQQLTLPGMS